MGVSPCDTGMRCTTGPHCCALVLHLLHVPNCHNCQPCNPLQAYSNDPSWASQGPALVAAPRLAGGRLIIELTAIKEAPRACENFRCLCTGEKGLGKASGKPLHYKGVRLHRVQKGFVAQGGDVVKVGGQIPGMPAARARLHPASLHTGCFSQGRTSPLIRRSTTHWRE